MTSLISREEFYAMQNRQFVEDTFEGSLPAFLAAFTKDRALTAEEAAKIRKMIDEAEGGEQEAIAAAKEQLNATQQTEQNSNQAWIYLENSSYSGFFAEKGYAANGKLGLVRSNTEVYDENGNATYYRLDDQGQTVESTEEEYIKEWDIYSKVASPIEFTVQK